MQELELPARLENFEKLMDFLRQEAMAAGFDEEMVNQILIASEEIVVNVIHYGYQGMDDGDVKIHCETAANGLVITVSDAGVPFDPLAKEDPDINQPVEERRIGGLGIFMTKKIMDEVTYARENGRNILTMVKRLPPQTP